METLHEYVIYLGWNITRLGKEADIVFNTARRAMDGKPVSSETATRIAAAISRALGRTVQPGEIKGLNIE